MAGPVSIDCEGLEGLDVAAAQVLIALRRRLATEGRTMCSYGLPTGIEQMLRSVGLGPDLGLDARDEGGPSCPPT
jgi:anti-anti-sigma regulatory factor